MTSAELQVMNGGSFPVWEPRTFNLSIPDWAKERISVYSQNPYLGVAASAGNARTALFPGNKELFPAGVLGVIPFGMGNGVKLTDLGRWQVHYHLHVYEKIPSAFNRESPGAPVSLGKELSLEELTRQIDGLKVSQDKIPVILRNIRTLQNALQKNTVPIPSAVPEYVTYNGDNNSTHTELKRDVDIVSLEGGTLTPVLQQDVIRKPRSATVVEGCCQIGHDGQKAYIKCDQGSSLCPFRFPSLDHNQISVVVDLERINATKLLCQVSSPHSFRTSSRGLCKELPTRVETDQETKEVYSLSTLSDSSCKLMFELNDYSDEPFSVFIKWDKEL